MQSIFQTLTAKFSPVTLANTAALITMLAWGTSFISTKIALADVPPFTLAFIRFFVTSVLLYAIIRKKEPNVRMGGKNRTKLALAGFIGICVYFCFENTAIELTTAANASLITSVTPILSIALNLVVFKARLSLLELLGVLIGIVGAYLTVTAHGNLDFSSAHFLGNLYMLAAMCAWAVYTILSKHLQSLYSGIFLVTWQTIFATAFLLPFALSEYDQWQPISVLSLLQILYLAIVCSGVGYFFYVYALKKLDVALTTLYLNLVPVIGVVSGYLILGEQVLPVQLFGGAIILLAIFTANLPHLAKIFAKRNASH